MPIIADAGDYFIFKLRESREEKNCAERKILRARRTAAAIDWGELRILDLKLALEKKLKCPRHLIELSMTEVNPSEESDFLLDAALITETLAKAKPDLKLRSRPGQEVESK